MPQVNEVSWVIIYCYTSMLFLSCLIFISGLACSHSLVFRPKMHPNFFSSLS